MKKTVIVLAATAMAAACMTNYSKSCADGVCTIVENGVTRYEGDPEKVAALEAAANRQQQAQADREAAWKSAAKKPADEKIRVGLVNVETSENSFKPFRQQVTKTLTEKLSAHPRIEVVPYQQISGTLRWAESKVPVQRGWNESGPREKSELVPNAPTFKKIRDMGVAADVLVFTYLSPKTESGLVGGGSGQGVGVASVSRVEVSGLVSSVYDFAPHRFSHLGKSAGSIDIAGVDKDGKASSASLKSTSRNFSRDVVAVEQASQDIINAIEQHIAAGLPAKAEVDRIMGRTGDSKTTGQPIQAIPEEQQKPLKFLNRFNDMLKNSSQ